MPVELKADFEEKSVTKIQKDPTFQVPEGYLCHFIRPRGGGRRLKHYKNEFLHFALQIL